MTHTNLVSGSSKTGKVLRSSMDAADVDPIPSNEAGQAPRDPHVESSTVPTAPMNLSLLVNQLYNQIKRELRIERERRGGMY